MENSKYNSNIMDGRTIVLAKIPLQEHRQQVNNIFLSPTLKHIIISFKEGGIFLFRLCKLSDYEHKEAILVWKHTFEIIESVIFSNDGEQFAVFDRKLQLKRFNIYNITESLILKETEAYFRDDTYSGSEARTSENVYDDQDFKTCPVLINLHKSQLIVYSKGVLSCLKIVNSECFQNYSVNIICDVESLHFNARCFYCLDELGVIYTYLLENGNLVGIYDIHCSIPNSLSFSQLYVNSSGTKVALLGNLNKIVITDIPIQEVLTELQTPNQLSAKSSTASISSYMTSASKTSNYSRVDSVRKEVTNKKTSSIVNASTASTAWFTFLGTLIRKKKKHKRNDDHLGTFVLIDDLPKNCIVQNIHFRQDGLSVWTIHPEGIYGLYRIYDESTGHLNSADILALDTFVVPLNTSCVNLDLFFHTQNLYLPLGPISRDILNQKLLGGESQNQVGEMIGNALYPLPLLEEGITKERVDMVRLALNLHTQGFKAKLCEGSDVGDLFKTVDELFQTIYRAILKYKSSKHEQWCLQISRLALTHANTLLSLPWTQSSQSILQIKILQHIVLLRREIELDSVDLPFIPQWSSWMSLSDEEIILHVTKSLQLVQCFLELYRNWTENDLQSCRFYDTIYQVFTNLLQDKQLDQAKTILTNVNLDPNHELEALCLKCEEAELRDYLVTNIREMKPSLYDAWKFLTVIESVLKSCQKFPKFNRSPLKIADILLFSSWEKNRIIVELYFSTIDVKLEVLLDKIACWEYLLDYNCTSGILAWLGDEEDGYTCWPLHLFKQWEVDQEVMDSILSADCTNLTRLIVCNKLASMGIFTTNEKKSPSKLIERLTFARLLPNVEDVLNQKTANLSFHEFSKTMFKHATKNDLVELATNTDISSLDTSDEMNKICQMDVNIFTAESPGWLQLFKIHSIADKSRKEPDICKAVEETTKYVASIKCLDINMYLKQHPLVAIFTDFLKGENICQTYSHVSPLLAASVPISPSKKEDITLYSMLAHTVPFHIDNIFQHQINTKKNKPLPNFSSEHLSLRYGSHFSLGYKEYLKQGRPATAVSYTLKKCRSLSKIISAVNHAHGLALSNANNTMITTSCVTFAELLGQDSTLMRTHIAIARILSTHLDEKELRIYLLHLVQGRENAPFQLLCELECFLLHKWKTSKDSILQSLHEFQLAVRFAVSHDLPPPTALLKYSLEFDNWLQFILTSQLFQFPVSKVLEVCREVDKNGISKHLYHALQNGNPRNLSGNDSVTTYEPETDLFACLACHGNNPEMLFSLSRQLNSTVLALLAGSLVPQEVETGLSMWLVASLSPEETYHCPEPPWDADSVTQLLEHVLKKGYFHSLARGFSLFIPVNPLSALANFFIESVVKRKFKESLMNLKEFMASYFNLPNEENKECSFLMNKDWIALTAYRMVCNVLGFSFSSNYYRQCFLKTLCEAQFPDIIQDEDYLPLLLRLSDCLADTPISLDWKRLCLQKDFSLLTELLNTLTEQHMFETAFKFANIAGLPVDCVLVKQWTVLSTNDVTRDNGFWQRCESALQKGNISPEIALSFYRNRASASNQLHERFILLRFALNWMYKTNCSKEDVTALQIELYTTCLQENFKLEVVTEGIAPVPLRCLSDELELSPLPTSPDITSCQFHRLDALIQQILVTGDIRTAFLLQALFHHSNQDCDLLLACMRLAEGNTSMSQLPGKIQSYLVDDTFRQSKLLFSSPFPTMSRCRNLLHNDNKSILNSLYAFQAHQCCKTALFSNIICGFKISVALQCDYKVIIKDPNPLGRLQPTDDFDIATSLLNLASLTMAECTQYVCSQIVNVFSSEPVDGKYMLWCCDLEKEYSCVLDLCGSPLRLGDLLLSSDLCSTFNASNLRQVVEILILAHNCYTRVCHMEGISSVLTFSRTLVNRLLNCCQWSLMVRLLTGIGRYTEMGYIFQILKDNAQFEFLLRKGLDKQQQLISAILEFVRCDKELFSLVTHHFSMYGELAVLYEEEARDELNKLEMVDGQLMTSAQNKNCLQAVMSKYTDATEHYIQAKKMKNGVGSVQLAELIAVQLSFFDKNNNEPVPCLINLHPSHVAHLVNTVLSCEQAHIVSNAYNISVDWSAALYYHCVLHGDISYLHAWNKRHQLDHSVFNDIVSRFQNERVLNPTLELNMKRLVSSVSLLDVKYRVASQLGFKDIVQQLLNSPDMAYLKDTVWQSGYKNQSV